MIVAIVKPDKINVTILPRVPPGRYRPASLPEIFFKYRAANRDGRCDDRFSVRSWAGYLISSVFRELRPLNAF